MHLKCHLPLSKKKYESNSERLAWNYQEFIQKLLPIVFNPLMRGLGPHFLATWMKNDLKENTAVVYNLGSWLLFGRSRLVRQKVHVRRGPSVYLV